MRLAKTDVVLYILTLDKSRYNYYRSISMANNIIFELQ